MASQEIAVIVKLFTRRLPFFSLAFPNIFGSPGSSSHPQRLPCEMKLGLYNGDRLLEAQVRVLARPVHIHERAGRGFSAHIFSYPSLPPSFSLPLAYHLFLLFLLFLIFWDFPPSPHFSTSVSSPGPRPVEVKKCKNILFVRTISVCPPMPVTSGSRSCPHPSPGQSVFSLPIVYPLPCILSRGWSERQQLLKLAFEVVLQVQW